MPYRGQAADVLARWREVERELKAADSGSDATTRLTAEWASLRTEYQRSFDAAVAHNRPVPDPWPKPTG